MSEGEPGKVAARHREVPSSSLGNMPEMKDFDTSEGEPGKVAARHREVPTSSLENILCLKYKVVERGISTGYSNSEMSLMISQMRQHLPAVLSKQSVRSNVAGSYFVTSTVFTRHFSQQVEINQRKLPADYDPATFDPTEHRSPPSERVWRLVDEVSGLTLVEVAEVSSIIMKRLDMTERPTVGVMQAGSAGLAAAMKGPEAAAKEEKKLEKTPAVFKKGVSKEEAEQIIDKMKAVGAKVVME